MFCCAALKKTILFKISDFKLVKMDRNMCYWFRIFRGAAYCVLLFLDTANLPVSHILQSLRQTTLTVYWAVAGSYWSSPLNLGTKKTISYTFCTWYKQTGYKPSKLETFGVTGQRFQNRLSENCNSISLEGKLFSFLFSGFRKCDLWQKTLVIDQAKQYSLQRSRAF